MGRGQGEGRCCFQFGRRHCKKGQGQQTRSEGKMKAYKMEALKRAVLIVLISAMVVTPSSVRAGQAAAKGATQPAQAVDKVDDDDTDQAQKLEEAKARERERQEQEREKEQGKQEREQGRQER